MKSRSRTRLFGRKSGWGGSRNTEVFYIVKQVGHEKSGLNLEGVVIGKVGLGRFHCTIK